MGRVRAKQGFLAVLLHKLHRSDVRVNAAAFKSAVANVQRVGYLAVAHAGGLALTFSQLDSHCHGFGDAFYVGRVVFARKKFARKSVAPAAYAVVGVGGSQIDVFKRNGRFGQFLF